MKEVRPLVFILLPNRLAVVVKHSFRIESTSIRFLLSMILTSRKVPLLRGDDVLIAFLSLIIAIFIANMKRL